mmetsp:Transcript_55602/g.165319  ORF Transcript_55602/g.165319 Transcript_55602/m.165319 type:complete len:235 (+) Transcript_55602:61-765(+)
MANMHEVTNTASQPGQACNLHSLRPETSSRPAVANCWPPMECAFISICCVEPYCSIMTCLLLWITLPPDDATTSSPYRKPPRPKILNDVVDVGELATSARGSSSHPTELIARVLLPAQVMDRLTCRSGLPEGLVMSILVIPEAATFVIWSRGIAYRTCVFGRISFSQRGGGITGGISFTTGSEGGSCSSEPAAPASGRGRGVRWVAAGHRGRSLRSSRSSALPDSVGIKLEIRM